MLGRSGVLADKLVLFDVVGFLADRLHREGNDMPTTQSAALIVVSTTEFQLRVEVVADEAATMRLQPGRRDLRAPLAVEGVLCGLSRSFEIRRGGARFAPPPKLIG